MNANDIRTKYLNFMQSFGHAAIAPAPLVLTDDPTTLFTGSGMQPLMPYLLGQKHPYGTRLVNSQPCMRLQDIEDVGDPRHTTVFEMLGNWSLGDYWKEEQIRNFFTFLVDEVKLNPENIYATCFIGNEEYGIPRDDEAAAIWVKVFAEHGIDAKVAEIGSADDGAKRGIKPGERIFFYDDKENWWSRGGGIKSTPIGDPCGPDSEVFYDFGEEHQDEAKYGKSHPASDGARFMEIGNQVFMQYRRLEDGSFQELEHKNIDFGGGLERIAAASINSHDVFKISLLKPIVDKLEQISGKSYDNNTDEMRIISDHLRGAYLLAAQGLVPSNKAQGYALRRLIRRSILKALNLGIAQDFLPGIVPIIAENYSTLPPEILSARDQALDVLLKEEKAFRQTINKGLKEFDKMFSPKNTARDVLIDAGDGTPISQNTEDGPIPIAFTIKDQGIALFKLYDTYGFPVELSVEEAFRRGIKLNENWRDQFESELNRQREMSKTAAKGMFKGGLADDSEQTVKYHTIAHLLLAAMQKHIGKDIDQRGANITPERLRFDFSIDHKLTPEEIKTLEDQVNEWIAADLPVVAEEFDTDYALDTLHAHGQFRDKYGDKVTVYTIGDSENPVSREVCGGPHVDHTGKLGTFKITKEESSSAGVRRLKATIS